MACADDVAGIVERMLATWRRIRRSGRTTRWNGSSTRSPASSRASNSSTPTPAERIPAPRPGRCSPRRWWRPPATSRPTADGLLSFLTSRHFVVDRQVVAVSNQDVEQARVPHLVVGGAPLVPVWALPVGRVVRHEATAERELTRVGRFSGLGHGRTSTGSRAVRSPGRWAPRSQPTQLTDRRHPGAPPTRDSRGDAAGRAAQPLDRRPQRRESHDGGAHTLAGSGIA